MRCSVSCSEWMGTISHLAGPVALLASCVWLGAEALKYCLPTSPQLCKPAGKVTVAFRSVPSCADMQKEADLSLCFSLPLFRTPQPGKSVHEPNPLTRHGHPFAYHRRQKWKVPHSHRRTSYRSHHPCGDDGPPAELTLSDVGSYITLHLYRDDGSASPYIPTEMMILHHLSSYRLRWWWWGSSLPVQLIGGQTPLLSPAQSSQQLRNHRSSLLVH